MNWIYSEEVFQPADIGSQIANTIPEINFTTVSNIPSPLTLDNLNELNNAPGSTSGSNVYLTSTQYLDYPSTLPSYLKGVRPDSTSKSGSAVSCAIIVNDHDNVTDVFYMYFYAFDYGGTIFDGVPFLEANLGDHVGDWEHNMVRFVDSKPSQLWYSQHSNGQAFEYSGLQKDPAGRPYNYVANGSHANYAIAGLHDHTLQIVNLPEQGFLTDYTDQGVLWDPTLSAYYYKYDAVSNMFTPYDDSTPVNWLYFAGGWGDQQHPDSDPRQNNYLRLNVERKYVSGPTGPLSKQLTRGANVCPDNGKPCILYSQAVAR